MAFGTVKFWFDDEGWCAVSSSELPDGRDLRAHFSAIEMEGYRALEPGRLVEFRYRAGRQDGFDFVAHWVKPLP